MIDTPSVDWLALSPTLALLAASAVALLGAVIVPGPRSAVLGRRLASRVRDVGRACCVVFDRSPEPSAVVVESMTRDRLGAAAVLVAVVGLAVVLVSAGDGRRSHVGEYYASPRPRPGWCSSPRREPDDDVPRARVVLDRAVHPLRARHAPARVARGRAQVPHRRSFGSGILLFGCALVYGATGELGFSAIQEATGADDPLFVTGMAMILAGLAFKVSAAPFHMWTPDVYQGAPTVTAFMAAATKVAGLDHAAPPRRRSRSSRRSGRWRSPCSIASLAIGNLAAIAQMDVKRMLALVGLARGLPLIAVAANSTAGASGASTT